MSPLLLLAAFIHQVVCKPSFIENDSIVFPDENNTSSSEITTKLNACLLEDKIEFNGECQTLLTKGDCPEGQWLVLDLVSLPKIVGKCSLKRCRSNEHFWVEQRRCVNKNQTSSLCPSGNEIDTDKFGDGFCKCINNPVHGKDKSGVCYPLYQRGPCAKDKVWVQVNERMECQPDHCINFRSQFPNKIVVPWNDGRCYKVEERGPCKEGYVVLVNLYTQRPECGDPIATLDLLNVPCSGTDHSGHCTQSVKTPPNYFLTQVHEQASKKRTRKSCNNPK